MKYVYAICLILISSSVMAAETPCVGQLDKDSAKIALALIGRADVKMTEAPKAMEVARMLQDAATQEDPACTRALAAEKRADALELRLKKK